MTIKNGCAASGFISVAANVVIVINESPVSNINRQKVVPHSDADMKLIIESFLNSEKENKYYIAILKYLN